MDIDAFTLAHRDSWERLDALTRRRRLSGPQTDELIDLYRCAARDLARARTEIPDPVLIAQLSQRVAAARGKVTGTRELRSADLRRFVTVTMPVALYQLRWWTLGVMIVEIALAALTAWWTLHDAAAMAGLGSPSERATYAHRLFESYYSTYAPPDFAAQVWTNNARLAAVCVVGGITGIVPAGVLALNAVSVGQAAAMMAEHSQLGVFLALIAPHGLLELTCLFVAGAAGLRLFWTLLVPGGRPRTQALAVQGRSLITVAVALTGALAVAGLIEAFVTPAPVPWALKIIVGVLALALLWAYTLVLGGRAVREGASADLEASDAGAWVPYAA